MRTPWRSAAVAALLPMLVCGQDAPARSELLSIEVTEGSAATVPRNAAPARRFLIRVKDAAGRPVPQVSVTFRLPESGPSGWFASGLKAESMMTDSRGEARVSGIRWNDEPGELAIAVVASSGARRAESRIPVEISATLAAPRPPAVGGSSSARKWILIAGVAVGAVAGLALARGGGGGSSTSATVQPVIVPPTIGTPTITIGRP